ncbi:diguanylate cyclase domain-containing protein [Burkholderiaceae bacterium UC74_6]
MPLADQKKLIELERRSRRRILAVLVLGNISLAALLAFLVWMVSDASRETYEHQAVETASNLANVVQANIASDLSRVDALMSATVTEIERLRETGHASDAEINRVLEAHRQPLRGVQGLRLTDIAGRVHWGNNLPTGNPIDLFDRPYFSAARDRKDGQVTVSLPVQSRVSGDWVIVLARATHSQGKFDGVLYATVAVEHFRKLFASYDIGVGDSVAMRTLGLELVARQAPGSKAEVQVGDRKISPLLETSTARAPNQGSYVAETALDGIKRVVAYRQVQEWPFYILAGIGYENYFTAWRQQTWHLTQIAAFAWLLLAGTSVALYRALRRASFSLRELAAQTRRTQTLLRVAGDGMHVIDEHGLLVDLSDSFAQMLGSTRAQMLGRHVSSWDVNQSPERISAWLAQVQDGDRQRVEVQHRREDGHVLEVELQVGVAVIDGQKFVYGSARDITERKRLLASVEAQAAQIRDLYDQAPCGYFSMDGDGVIVHANATLLDWIGCSAEEVLQQERFTEFLSSASADKFKIEFQRLKSDGRIDGLEVQLQPPAGYARMLRADITAVWDDNGNFATCRCAVQDVTIEQEAQAQVTRLLREQATMLDNDILGMAKLREREVIWRNRAVDRIFGYAPGELDHQPVRKLYADEASFSRVGSEGYTQMSAGRHYRTQVQMRHKQGHILWIDLSGVLLSPEITLWTMADITLLKQAQAHAEYVAFHDGLTGLPNRLLLADRMQQAVVSAARTKQCVAVCYLDLDGFKPINDRHGHDSGDAVLVEVGQRLRQVLRGADTAARVGGDEFVVILHVQEDEAAWRPILERLIQAIQQPITLDNGSIVRVGTSIGVALAPRDGTEMGALLALADQAMLCAKRAGKGQVARAQSQSSAKA